MQEEDPGIGSAAAEPDADAALPSLLTPLREAGAWLREGARVLALRTAPGRPAGPATLFLLLLACYLSGLLSQRAFIEGEAHFLWQGFLGGWPGTLLLVALAWLALRHPAPGREHPPLPTLLALAFSGFLVLGLAETTLLLAVQAALGAPDSWSPALRWSLWALPLAWALLMLAALLGRVAAPPLARAAVVLALPAVLALHEAAPAYFWWQEPTRDEEEAAAPRYTGLPLTEQVLSAQPRLLDAALNSLAAPQPDRINVYGLSYAPYAREDVFLRESAAVAATLRERFGAQQRFVELVANPATLQRLPWATPATLQTSIARIAARMDRERDVLFLHLTSHGGADGKLAADTWPLQTEDLTPQQLRRWLDEAGVRWRVISVSACYSGSWIAPLAGEGTLVMTAADADHTSYGCGRKSPITFFGRAMYQEALRETRDFEAAHAQARQVIEKREQEAGKDDGYSNPQIRMGADIRPVLQRLAREQGVTRMREPQFHDLMPAASQAQLAAEAAAGLLAPAAHSHPKLFYDALGSHLFDAITELDEYALTRSEAAVFAQHGEAIAAALREALPPQPTLIDLGAGSCAKGERLFRLCEPGRYVAVDISVDFLRQSLACLQRAHPERELHGVGLDFAEHLALPAGIAPPGSLVFYPGSSIGNFAPEAARRLLREARELAQGGALLIGVDLVKPAAELEAAYDDALGVTAAFNLNLLRRLNRLLGADFQPRQWRHLSRWNEAEQRVEMHLEAREALRVRWPGAERVFERGERIHTENAYKWTTAGFEALLREAGFGRVRAWTDAAARFGLLLAS